MRQPRENDRTVSHRAGVVPTRAVCHSTRALISVKAIFVVFGFWRGSQNKIQAKYISFEPVRAAFEVGFELDSEDIVD